MIPVLLVEDGDDYREIVRRAFAKAGVTDALYLVADGEEAMEFLRHAKRYADPSTSPRPGLILLDLNMPHMDGREALREIKQDPKLRQIPVVMLTTSGEPADVLSCYDLGANSFVQKPVDFGEFVRTLNVLTAYWLRFAKIPDTRVGQIT